MITVKYIPHGFLVRFALDKDGDAVVGGAGAEYIIETIENGEIVSTATSRQYPVIDAHGYTVGVTKKYRPDGKSFPLELVLNDYHIAQQKTIDNLVAENKTLLDDNIKLVNAIKDIRDKIVAHNG